jgi:hypothetical protein
LFNKKGVPIGNLTSQLFANVYMNEFDQFVKHELKIRHYVRYTDDFVVAADNYAYLEDLLPRINEFLEHKLALKLHPNKVGIRKFRQGIDFLGHIIFSKYRLIRLKTKRRMFAKIKYRIEEFKSKKISKLTLEQSLQSYLGVLSHADSFQLKKELINYFWFELTS